MPKQKFQHLGAVIQTTHLPKYKQSYDLPAIYSDWAKCAGENIAQHTLELKIDGPCLHVSVDSGIWAHSVSYQHDSILSKLSELGHQQLREIITRIKIRTKQPPLAHSLAVTASQTRKITPEMSQVFSELAEHAVNPKVRATFKRLSKLEHQD